MSDERSPDSSIQFSPLKVKYEIGAARGARRHFLLHCRWNSVRFYGRLFLPFRNCRLVGLWRVVSVLVMAVQSVRCPQAQLRVSDAGFITCKAVWKSLDIDHLSAVILMGCIKKRKMSPMGGLVGLFSA